MQSNNLYNKYSDYLKNKYGEKIYKLPVHIPVTCPNRDGKISCNGCIFCGDLGVAYEFEGNREDVVSQIDIMKTKISKRYGAKKFIAYFQSFTNTYLKTEIAMRYFKDSIQENIVGIYISTRPDCISDELLENLYILKENKGIDIVIELGLQTVNYKTLKKINRGHSLAEFIDAAVRIHKYNLEICVHMILDLPWDDIDDAVEGAKILSALNIEQVKMHSLYVVKGTKLENMINAEEIKLCSKNEYIERAIMFLSYLNPDIVVQRIIGRAPKEVAKANWDSSWWKIKDEILNEMSNRKIYQGSNYDYLDSIIKD